MTDFDDLIGEFLLESREGLERLDRDLVDLEQDPRNAEKLASVFRAVHTIKGTCGFLGYSKLESVSHVGESLLSRLRDGEMTLDASVTTALLAMVDAIREILAFIEVSGNEGPADYTDVVARLQALDRRPDVSVEAVDGVDPAAVVATADAAITDDRVIGDSRKPPASDGSLRIDVGLVDKLMNLVGELVLARNQIVQCLTTSDDASMVSATQRLSLVTSELQDGVMKTRMQPIGHVWSRFPRVVRDLASSCGKQVRIEMEGQDTEFDRSIVEAIRDPLTHIIRNSVDHGIEAPALRIANGKPPEGTIRLRACHRGGQVHIEISDDGAGIAAEKVRQRAVARGLIGSEQSQRLSERDLASLIFLPGFSTAETITNVSGRGVGMDVVKTNIERTGGTVDIHSVSGVGTTLHITIPLTLAIIPALMVSSSGERFAIPQIDLLEVIRLEDAARSAAVERIGPAMYLRWRATLLPLVYLHGALRLPPPPYSDDGMTIVVLETDQRQYGLVVDTIQDTEEIVVKPLGKALKALTAFAGATVMGDGKIALILDVLGLGVMSRVVSDTRSDRSAASEAAPAASAADDSQALLVFHASQHDRMAIPVSWVARLEELPRHLVERSGNSTVVQYRGGILPLVSLARYFDREEPVVDPLQVIVVSRDGQRVGLVVERIVDIVRQVVVVDTQQRRRGVAGSTIVQQQVTDLVDVDAVMADNGLLAAAAVA